MIISKPEKEQNKTTEKQVKFDVGMVGRLKIEPYVIKEHRNSKFFKQMPEISNSKGYFFLLVESQIERKKRPSKNIYWNKAVPALSEHKGKTKYIHKQ